MKSIDVQREPMEQVYGKEYFPQLWEEWVDAITDLAYSTQDKNLCRQILPDIRCPSLIIHGNKDAMVASEHPEYLHKRIPNSRYLLSCSE